MGNLIGDIADFLVSKSLAGGSTGWALFEELMPNSPDQAVGIYSIAGKMPETTMGIDYPSFRILVRGAPKQATTTARDKAVTILRTIHYANDIINTQVTPNVFYVHILAVSSTPQYLGMDSNLRHEYAINFSGIGNLS